MQPNGICNSIPGPKTDIHQIFADQIVEVYLNVYRVVVVLIVTCRGAVYHQQEEPLRLARTNFDPNPLILPETRLPSSSPFPGFFFLLSTIKEFSRHWSTVFFEYFLLTDY